MARSKGHQDPVGMLVFGDDQVAVDPTCARVARLNPKRELTIDEGRSVS